MRAFHHWTIWLSGSKERIPLMGPAAGTPRSIRAVLAPLFSFLFALLLVVPACAPSPQADALEPDAFASAWRSALTKADEGAAPAPLLVDVYRPEVRERSKALEGAHVLRIGTDKPRKAFASIDRSTPVYLYCGDGRGAAQIAKILDDMGFAQIGNLQGGMKAWVQAGRPTVEMAGLNSMAEWPSEPEASPKGENPDHQSTFSPADQAASPSTPSDAEHAAADHP